MITCSGCNAELKNIESATFSVFADKNSTNLDIHFCHSCAYQLADLAVNLLKSKNTSICQNTSSRIFNNEGDRIGGAYKCPVCNGQGTQQLNESVTALKELLEYKHHMHVDRWMSPNLSRGLENAEAVVKKYEASK